MLQIRFALGIVLAASPALAQPKPTRTLTICDMRSHAKKYLGKVITVTGEVQRTGHHGVGIGSSECPSWGAALVESNEMENPVPQILSYSEKEHGRRSNAQMTGFSWRRCEVVLGQQ